MHYVDKYNGVTNGCKICNDAQHCTTVDRFRRPSEDTVDSRDLQGTVWQLAQNANMQTTLNEMWKARYLHRIHYLEVDVNKACYKSMAGHYPGTPPWLLCGSHEVAFFSFRRGFIGCGCTVSSVTSVFTAPCGQRSDQSIHPVLYRFPSHTSTFCRAPVSAVHPKINTVLTFLVVFSAEGTFDAPPMTEVACLGHTLQFFWFRWHDE